LWWNCPVDGLVPDVLEGVVHPAHVPLEAEAEAAGVGRLRRRRARTVDSSAMVTTPGNWRWTVALTLLQELRRLRGSRGRRIELGIHSPSSRL
jgi:hypothetical protein